MRDEIFINSPLKRGQSLGSGGGLKFYEEENLYASTMGYEIVGANTEWPYERKGCLAVTYHHDIKIIAFGSYYEEAHILAKEMNAFWSDKIYRRIEREEAMETKEYKTLINKMSKLCHKAIGEAVKQPGVLDRLVKVVAQDAYNTGVEDTKRELRKFLGVRRYD